jgi:uncharacterized protein
MNRRTAIVAFAWMLGILVPFMAQAQAPAKQRVIFQVSDNDPEKWKLALSNALNVQMDLGKNNVEIEIMAYGPGLPMLGAESKVADRLAQALDNNVALIACENTMQTTKVSRDDMYYGIKYVQAGVTHLMKRQQEGWAYIRP